MPSILQRPVFHYGIPALSAGIVALIAVTLLQGTVRWVALAIAAAELVVTPQILKRAE